MADVKMVDGVPVPLTPEDLAQIEADRQAATSPSVPGWITKQQAQVTLYRAGLLDAALVAVYGADRETQIRWEAAALFYRDDPTLLQIAAALNPPLTSEQVDALFIEAAQA